MFFVFLTGFLFVGGTWAKIPEGFILGVTPTCASTVAQTTTVQVITDLRVAVEAACADGTTYSFTSLDEVFWDGTFAFTAGLGASCLFEKLSNSNTYRLKVSVAWGDPLNFIMDNSEEFMITCTYDAHGQKSADPKTLTQSLMAPPEIQENLGTSAASTFDLQVMDVSNNAVSDPYPIGKKIKLTGTISGATGEVGVRAVSCDAVSGGGTKYAVLRGGCGDGIIFRQDRGFVTNGLKTESPFFSAFYLKGSKAINFECNFTTCTANCDGDSCTSTTRRRRGLTDLMPEIIGHPFVASSQSFRIDTTSLQPSEQWLEKKLETVTPSTNSVHHTSIEILLGGVVLCVLSFVILVTAVCCQRRQNLKGVKAEYRI